MVWDYSKGRHVDSDDYYGTYGVKTVHNVGSLSSHEISEKVEFAIFKLVKDERDTLNRRHSSICHDYAVLEQKYLTVLEENRELRMKNGS